MESVNDPVIPADTLRELEAAIDRRQSRRRGQEVAFLCPAHNDHDPSAAWNGQKQAWVCRQCGAGGGWTDLCKRLGVELPLARAARLKYVAPKGVHRYTVYDADGFDIIATKVREDDGEGHKTMWWEGPDGSRGLPEGLDPKNLLYHAENLDAVQTFITEGERAAESLLEHGYQAIGTMTGAGPGKSPSAESLEVLRGLDVCLWPDNDEAGRSFMQEVAATLYSIGIVPKIVVWPTAPEKGDAADYLAEYGDLRWIELWDYQPPEPRFRTAAELMLLKLPEPRFPIPGILSEGLNILAGKPKLGKSWLALQLGLAVASGGRVLGSIRVEQGDVLYLALEDTWRRLQSRMSKLLWEGPAPERLSLATRIDRLDEGGLDIIEGWLREHPNASMVVLDTFQKARPLRSPKGADLYAEDYRHGALLKDLGDKYHVAVVAVHHTRKATNEDPLESVSGTNGLAGSADGVLVLKRDRNEEDAKLFITGRDVDESELDLQFHPRLVWTLAPISSIEMKKAENWLAIQTSI